jgi:hypothetical protein
MEGVKHQRLLNETKEKISKRRRARRNGRGPGVLEHRISPRLEWLTDFGCLSKEGIKKNGFQYIVSPTAQSLLEEIDRHFGSADMSSEVAISQWHSNPQWSEWRQKVSYCDATESITRAYKLVRRQVGPVPIRVVSLISSMFASGERRYSDSVDSLLEFAKSHSDVALSGGRYKRDPENIFIPGSLLT